MLSIAAQLALAGLLVTVLLLAVRHDMLEHRIPNALCGVALAGGLSLQTLASGSSGLAVAVGGAAVGLLAFMPFYLMRGMGAGDVKLMTAVGSFLGPTGAFFAAAATLVLGAVLAIGIIVVRKLNHLHSAGSGADSINLKEKFPYAIAIAGGALILMWHQGHLARLVAIITA